MVVQTVVSVQLLVHHSLLSCSFNEKFEVKTSIQILKNKGNVSQIFLLICSIV